MSEGECQPGTLICNPDGSGGVICTGEVTPIDEVCDALDNDCDRKIDEGLGLGDKCGSNEGLCEEGSFTCVNGRAVCEGGRGPAPETCDCQDNDCDGKVDETSDDSTLCPGTSACVMCQCALPC